MHFENTLTHNIRSVCVRHIFRMMCAPTLQNRGSVWLHRQFYFCIWNFHLNPTGILNSKMDFVHKHTHTRRKRESHKMWMQLFHNNSYDGNLLWNFTYWILFILFRDFCKYDCTHTEQQRQQQQLVCNLTTFSSMAMPFNGICRISRVLQNLICAIKYTVTELCAVHQGPN